MFLKIWSVTYRAVFVATGLFYLYIASQISLKAMKHTIGEELDVILALIGASAMGGLLFLFIGLAGFGRIRKMLRS